MKDLRYTWNRGQRDGLALSSMNRARLRWTS